MRQLFGGRSTNKSVLVLQGGIGNQLFQINTFLKSNPEYLLIIQSNRSLEKFSWESSLIPSTTRVRQAKHFQQRIGRFVGRYILHLNFKPTFFERHVIATRLIYVILQIIVSIVYKKWLKFIIDSESEIFFQSSNYFMCGYFHNQEIPVDLHSRSIVPFGLESDEFRCYVELIKIEKPICVHIRRGDYLVNSQFRILDADYYNKSLAILNGQIGAKNIWVFSDSIDEARKIMSVHSSYNITYVSSVGTSDFESLELMRHARAFIIANSTFSVWSALLAYDSKPPTIIPADWFNHPSLKSDKRLKIQTPPHWTAI